jgi:hypothetical protein
MDLVTEYNLKALDTMKIEDKMGGHVSPMGEEKYIQIVRQRGKNSENRPLRRQKRR